jgi:hypothetical protein
MAVEGQMVDAGMKLYRLADLAIVWVMSQVYEQDLAFVQLGQEATVSLSYLPDRKFRGRVTYLYPTVDEKTRTARVRMEFHNPGYFLKPGMFATVELQVELEASTLLVPDMAVLRSGEKNTVFVALAGGKFEPRTVTLGPRSENNMYQVLAGLNEGERVVTSGQFMLDSESQLREAIQKMLKPSERQSVGASERESEGVSSTLNAPNAPRSTTYICPMPEHVSLKYSKPGKCPLCGMALVPVSAELLARIQPGGRVEHYTCPMPEHSDVKLDKSGSVLLRHDAHSGHGTATGAGHHHARTPALEVARMRHLCVPFPPHPGPLPGERENHPLLIESQGYATGLRDSTGAHQRERTLGSGDGCSLSPRERVRVRGKETQRTELDARTALVQLRTVLPSPSSGGIGRQ